MASEEYPLSSHENVRLGKYRVLAHLAAGGMAVVYRAVDDDTGQEVALKVLPPEVSAKPATRERFRREARHGSRLRHDNLVAIYDCDEVDGICFLVMELVEGIDLHQYIERHGRLSSEEARQILIQVTQALDYAHRMGVIHRDIKPGNILLTEKDGRTVVKLSDLGLAREVSDTEFRVTREGNTVGTIDYMSPEQARDSGLADIRSDIYSLGCTFHHMLTGEPPFAEGSLPERLYKHAEVPPPDVRLRNPAVPAALAMILHRMLAKRAGERYQSPAELLEDLNRTDWAVSPGDFVEIVGPEFDAVPPASATAKTVESAARPMAGEEERRPSDQVAATAASAPETAASDESVPLAGRSAEHRQVAAGHLERANQAIAIGNYNEGIQLLLKSCKLNPPNTVLRRALRQAQRARCPRRSRWAVLSWLTNLPAKLRFRAAVRSEDHLRVLEIGERVLTRNPYDVSVQIRMAESAEALGYLPLAACLLIEARAADTRSMAAHRALAHLAERQKHFREAITLWEVVRRAHPLDHEAINKVRDLTAHDTIARGRYLQQLAGDR